LSGNYPSHGQLPYITFAGSLSPRRALWARRVRDNVTLTLTLTSCRVYKASPPQDIYSCVPRIYMNQLAN